MERQGFLMRLKPGCVAEYKRRHDAIWPELVRRHAAAGVRNYTIYHDPDTDALFATRELAAGHAAGRMAEDPLVQRWWAHMADLMECHPSNEPVARPLTEVFHMD